METKGNVVKGLIVVAYQGMGKTTLAGMNQGSYFDLESSGYSRENPEWYKEYVQDAINLAQGGEIPGEQPPMDIVFVSSHKVVRDYLIETGFPFIIMYPTVSKNVMMDRLAIRYFKDKSIKNASALANCVLDYDTNIQELREYSNAIGSDNGFIKQEMLEQFISMNETQVKNVINMLGGIKLRNQKRREEKVGKN